ncbi:N-6 DNA methylase [Staphylococcus pseudintermedius]|nr:N-6 DNA methylase [Staphylococcus pseudintermedius]MDE9957268.1 N-6 DNA methylase [Staphylococcus pseudintermedius]
MKQKESLWEIADVMRGEADYSEYMELILVGGLFLHLSNDPRYEKLIDIQEVLRAEENAKKKFNETLNKIEERIPYFEGIFKELTYLEKVESTQITRLFYTLSSMNSIDNLNEKLDEMIKRMTIIEGRKGAEHYTPRSINQLAISILKPNGGTIYDGTMGMGSGLLEAARQTTKNKLDFYGQEIKGNVWAITKIRFFVEGVEDSYLKKGDVLQNPAFLDHTNLKKFDYVYMNAPFSLKLQNHDIVTNDPYNRFYYGVPAKSNADFAFISHALASMNQNAKAIVVATHGTLFRGGIEGEIRENMILSDVIEAVVSLPANLYQNTAIPVCLVLFNKNKAESRKNKILFVQAEKLYNEKNRFARYISGEAIEKISTTINEGIELDGFSTFVNREDLFESNLNTKRYILPREMEIEHFGTVEFNINKMQDIKMFQLEKAAHFFRGYNVGTKNKETTTGKYKIIQLADVQDGKLLLDQVKNYDIDNNARVDMYKLKKNDVILSIRGTVLKAAIISENIDDLLLSQNFIGIRCNDQLHPEYLKAYLESPLGKYLLMNRMSGTSIPTLSRKDIQTLSIPKLSIEKQKEIMDQYNHTKNNIEEEIKRLQNELKKLKLTTYREMGIKELFITEEE